MKRIRELRKKKSLTGEKLGKLVGVQKSAISKYERGEIQPSNDVLVLIADTLNTTTDYLLGRTDNPAPLSDASVTCRDEHEKALIQTYRQMNVNGKEKVIDYINDLTTTNKYIKNNSIPNVETSPKIG